MRKLEAELLKLQEKGEGSLVSEIEALMRVKSPPKNVPVSHKFLSLAATEIHNRNFDIAHDLIGAAIEIHQSREPVELTSTVKYQLNEVKADDVPSSAFKVPLPDLSDKDFYDAPEGTVLAFADVLISAGYVTQAKKYVEAFNKYKIKESEMAFDKKQALLDLQSDFKKQGNLAMVKAADEMLKDLDDEDFTAESQAAAYKGEAALCKDDCVKSGLMKAAYMMKAAEEMEHDGLDASAMKAEAEKCYKDAKEQKSEAKEETLEPKELDGRDMLKEQKQEFTASKKPVLYVESASAKESKLRGEAALAATNGELTKARVLLKKVENMERARLVAALIKAGDSDLAMEGLKEEEPEYKEPAEEPAQKFDEEAHEKMEHSEMPESKLSVEEPSKEPEVPAEEDMAKDLEKKVESSLRRGRMRDAVVAFTTLNELEQAVVAGVKLCGKSSRLKKEGLKVWTDVARSRFKAEALLAEHEKEDEVLDKAMEGMEMLEDESQAAKALDLALDDMDEAKAEEITKELITPPGGVSEDMHHAEELPEEHELHELAETEEEEMEEHEKGALESEESEAMHYEVLQSLAEIKELAVSRDALAFTFWEDENSKNPFYVIQAAGKPIGEIHLADQDNANEIRAYFCDEQKYTKALAQSVENTTLYEMLKGVHARFYANAVDNTDYAKRMKDQAIASVGEVRSEKLTQLRRDLTDAMVTASEALNKGLYDKPNALKSSFVKILSSYGIMNPAVAVEAAFKESGVTFFNQVMDGANEYLEMPKEAFVHAKKMIAQAQNVAFAQANNFSDMPIGQRLAQNSLPFESVPERQDAPVTAFSRDYSEQMRKADYKDRLKLGRKF